MSGSPTRRRPAHPRLGFSLIELLIVVAIIAALVGAAVPFFQNNLAEAQRTKAMEDLQVLQKAIALYESRESKLLAGTSLKPLLGKYVQEIPKDPWGNDYLWDGAAAFLATYGADSLAGGTGSDADIPAAAFSREGGLVDDETGNLLLVLPVMLRRVQYQGAAGPPRPPGPAASPDFRRYGEGNKLILSFTRPVVEVDPAALAGDCVIKDLASTGPKAWLTDTQAFHDGTWLSAADPYFAAMVAVDSLHRPDQGVVVLRAVKDCTAGPLPNRYAVRPGLMLHFENASDPGNAPASCRATYTVGATPVSPLEPAIYGAEASRYLPTGPLTNDSVEVFGMEIEKY